MAPIASRPWWRSGWPWAGLMVLVAGLLAVLGRSGYAAWARAAQNSPVVAQYTQTMAELWRSIARALPDGGRALVITHGGIVEAGTIGCLPSNTQAAYHTACGVCEGVRLTFDGDTVVNMEILRVEQPSV